MITKLGRETETKYEWAATSKTRAELHFLRRDRWKGQQWGSWGGATLGWVAFRGMEGWVTSLPRHATHYRKKAQAQHAVVVAVVLQKEGFNNMSNGKPLDISDTEWSEETVGLTEFRILRKKDTRIALVSIYKDGPQKFVAAMKGKGTKPLEGPETWEEAMAVCTALIRME